MLTIHHLHKSFGIQPILRDVSFSVNAGERLALVGPNGCGKTTLLRIVMGHESADSGVISRAPAGLRIGYLPQGFTFPAGETLGGYMDRMGGNVEALGEQVADLAGQLTAQPQRTDLQAAYDTALARLEAAADSSVRAPALLAALGLDELPRDLPAAHLSGGQKTRLALAGVLLSAPQLLLLDEPTNHLDIAMLEWLENWLLRFEGGVLLASHDRAFLDRTATGILELDAFTHAVRAYPGNYSAYLEQKGAERERHWQDFRDQQDEIGRLQDTARHMRGLARFKVGGKADTGDKFAKGFFANRSLGTMGRAKNIEARIERLLNEDHIDKPRLTWQMKIEFGETPGSGRAVLSMQDLRVGYGEIVLLRDLNLHLRLGERLALIGPNGTGKTTLLRTIAGHIPPLGGTLRLGANVRPGFMTQEQEELDPALNALQAVQAILGQNETAVRSFLSLYLFKGDDVFIPAGQLSYGQRARLSLACLVARGCNFLLLDEPINHLDIPARTSFEQALAGFEGTVAAVVHDRYFIERFASRIWEVRGGTIMEYEI